MPSQAYANYLVPLLDDADELLRAHQQLRTGNRGRQWGLGGLNRACVVMSVSAWEGYLEEVVLEAHNWLRPAAPPLGSWPAMNVSLRSLIGRFNNPNPDKTRDLFRDGLGHPNITLCWTWTNCSPARAVERLNEALRQRHQVAHGVNPRPTIHNKYAKSLPPFFKRLGRCTDDEIADYLSQITGLPKPW